MFNLLIGGAAGQGVETTTAILEKMLQRSGYHLLTVRDLMSRIRGGHNFSVIAFGDAPVLSHSDRLDVILALNQETAELHLDRLKPDGFLICDSQAVVADPRVIPADLTGIGKTLGNPRAAGSVLIGLALRLFGVPLADAPDVLTALVGAKNADVNVTAMALGYGMTEQRYNAPVPGRGDSLLLSGSQALALGAIAAGLKFYSAYPMSPSTPVMEYLAKHSEEAGVVVEQAEDEIAAVNMAIGASFAGVRAMTATSGGGFSLMVEALGLSGMAEIPLVAVNFQRPGPATGLPTRTEQGDLKFVISAAQGEFPRMVIALRDHRDCFYQTQRAFEIAEKYQIPVILLSDQYLGDSTTTVRPFYIKPLPNASPAAEYGGDYLRYQLTENGISPRLLPGKTTHPVTADSDEHDQQGRITESADVRIAMVDKRMRKLRLLEQELQEPEFFGPDTYDLLLIGWGSTSGPIKDAVVRINKTRQGSAAAIIFGDVWPFPKKRLLEKAARARRLCNVEQNATGQLACLIREQTGLECTSGILKYSGRQLSGEEIAGAVLAEALP